VLLCRTFVFGLRTKNLKTVFKPRFSSALQCGPIVSPKRGPFWGQKPAALGSKTEKINTLNLGRHFSLFEINCGIKFGTSKLSFRTTCIRRVLA